MAAVDCKHRTRHERRGIGGQQQERSVEIFRLPDPALRHAAEALRTDRELLRQAGEARQLKSKVYRVTAARVWSYVRECS